MRKFDRRKPNKIWVDKGGEFYNNSFKKGLKDNDIEMYSKHNERKSVVAERFIRTLKSKIYKYMTSISKNVYIDKLDDIVDEYRTIKMKPIDVKDNAYINFEKKLMIKIQNLKLVIMLEFLNTKIFLLKDIHQIGLKKFLLLVKLKIQFHGHMVKNDLNGEEITGGFYEKELQKTNKKEFRIEKVIRRKGDKLYVKWKRYDNSFNSWINKKDLV